MRMSRSRYLPSFECCLYLIGVVALSGLTVTPVSAEGEVDGSDSYKVEWVEVGKADPAQVDGAIAALEVALNWDEGGTRFFAVRLGDKVAVCGSEQQLQAAKEVLTNVPPAAAPRQFTRIAYVKATTPADLQLLDQLRGAPGLATWEYGPQHLILQGTEAELERTLARLIEAKLIYDEQALTCETVRLYYLRQPQLVKEMLANMPAGLVQDVTVLSGDGAAGPPMLVLAGPQSQVRNLKRVIAALDVPQPEVRLDIWAFQLSGSNASEVAQRAQKAQAEVTAVARLVRGYLRQLEAYAQDRLQENQARLDAGAEKAPTFRAMIGVSEPRSPDTCIGLSPGAILTPSARGPHPLSLTETLAILIAAQPMAETAVMESTKMGIVMDIGDLALTSERPEGARRAMIEDGLNAKLSGWLNVLQADDPEALATWLRVLKQESSQRCAVLVALLEEVRTATAAGQQGGSATASHSRALLPWRLLALFGDEQYARTASDSITGFLAMQSAVAEDWSTVSAEHLRMRSADAQIVLENAERALAEDIQALFLHPLQNELRRLAGSGRAGGLGSASTTSISVLSGTQAHMVGSAVSYFDVSVPPTLDTAALEEATKFSRALAGYLPRRSTRGVPRVVVRIILDRNRVGREDLHAWPDRLQRILPAIQVWPLESETQPAMMLVGTKDEVDSAVSMLKTGGVVASVQPMSAEAETAPVIPAATAAAQSTMSAIGDATSGIPADRLLALAMQFGQPPQLWTALTEGVSLTFTPHILPGGSAAELAIDFQVLHDDPGGGQGATSAVPLSRVAKHHAKTNVYIHALDLFSLSSLTLATTHPRPKGVIPILGQLPFLGKMFRYPRSPSTVYHESVLMVYSTILPTGADLAATLDVRSMPHESQ